MNNYCILTVVESLSVTSMPVNEFVLYRHSHHYPHRQVLISCSKRIPSGLIIPDDIDLRMVGRSLYLFRRNLVEIKKICDEKKEVLIVHLHSQRAALLFYLASVGLGIRARSVFSVHNTYKDRNIKYKVSSFVCSLFAGEIVCVSRAAFDGYSEIIKRLRRNHICAIQNGVDYDRVDNTIMHLKSHSNYLNTKRLVCVARLITIKNQEFLIQLLPQLPELYLILIGEGKQKENLKALAKKLGVERRVTFTGLIKREDVFRILNECDIYVSSSHVEGLPISVLEAMSIGLYPILSDIPSHRNITCHFSFDTIPLSSQKWIEAINKYYLYDLSDRQRLSTFIKNEVKNLFSLSVMHSLYDIIYQKIAQRC